MINNTRETGFALIPVLLGTVLISTTLVASSFALLGNIGINVADEGFLWYGALHTASGDVPLRDFQSYDPGRYYWVASWFKLTGSEGILSLRVSSAICQLLGLSFGLLTLRRVLGNWLALVAAGAVLQIWMFPFWKAYEPALTLAAVYIAVLLIEKPSLRRHSVAGVCVGLAAFMGRNHGLYCFMAFLLLILFIHLRIESGSLHRRVGAWLAGVVAGYSPMLLMFIFVPDFFESFVESLRRLFQLGTNLSLPVPWPWTVNYSSLGPGESVQAFSVGLLYLILPAFYIGAGAILLRSKHGLRRKAVFIACTFIGAVYLHYTFDRPQLYYLAWTIQPFIIGLLAIPYSFGSPQRGVARATVWAFVVIMTWACVWLWSGNYYWVKAKAWVKVAALERYQGSFALIMREYGFVKTDVAGDDLWLLEADASLINRINAFYRQEVSPGEGLLCAGYWPALYPILQKKSPVWEIYFLFPEAISTQEQMIKELEEKYINWIFLYDYKMDDRDDRTFERTHEYVWQYVSANFDLLPVEGLPPEVRILRRR